MTEQQPIFVAIGNWDRHKKPPENGFGLFRFNADTGALTPVGSAAPQITVGAVCLSPDRSVLYCVDEYTNLPGYFLGGGGQVYAFRIDRNTGALTEINRTPSFGALPSALALDMSGRFLIVTHHTDRVPVTKIAQDANGAYRIALAYDDATTVLFPLGADGAIGAPCHVHTHSGDGGPLPRQTHPQLHHVARAPHADLFLVTDKGNDEIVAFTLDQSARKLRRCGAYKAPPGSSPRYMAFHPTRPFVFVNHETQAIVSTLRYSDDGALDHVATLSALPSGQADAFEMKQSDIIVHPDGAYLYSFIRGISAASFFAIDQTSGALTRVETVALDIKGPRAGAISPDGHHLVIAGWDSKEVSTWRIGEGGALTPTGHKLMQPNPGTVTFL